MFPPYHASWTSPSYGKVVVEHSPSPLILLGPKGGPPPLPRIKLAIGLSLPCPRGGCWQRTKKPAGISPAGFPIQ